MPCEELLATLSKAVNIVRAHDALLFSRLRGPWAGDRIDGV